MENQLRKVRLGDNEPLSTRLRIINWVKDFGWLVISFGRVNIKLLRGKDWKVYFIQDDFTQSEEELIEVLFPNRPQIEFIDRIFIWQINPRIPKMLDESDLVLCDLNHLIRIRPMDTFFCFSVPPWVLMEVEIGKPIEDVLSAMTQMRRRDIRKIEQAGFTYHFSQDPADLELFYHEMYVPYISSRFGERAIIASYKAKQAMFIEGGLIMVEYQGQPMAGLLGYAAGETFNIGSIGIRKGHFDLAKKGIMIALNWYAIKWANSKGYQYVNFGMTRPRVYDGVFEAKRNWGTQIRRNLLDHTRWQFLGKGVRSVFGRYLNQAGFISHTDGKFQVVFIDDKEYRPSAEELERITKIVEGADLAGITLL
jgi:hypothetical protein